MLDLEEIFKGVVSIIILIIFLGAIIPLFDQINIGISYSFIIGFMFLAIIIAFLMKVLNELGVKNVF